MSTHHCRPVARFIRRGLYLVTCPDFPRAAFRIEAPDKAEALSRALPWLAGCVVGPLRDG